MYGIKNIDNQARTLNKAIKPVKLINKIIGFSFDNSDECAVGQPIQRTREEIWRGLR